jgi:hypothetical protein
MFLILEKTYGSEVSLIRPNKISHPSIRNMGSSIGHRRRDRPKCTFSLVHMESILQHFESTLEMTIQVSASVLIRVGQKKPPGF